MTRERDDRDELRSLYVYRTSESQPRGDGLRVYSRYR
jgi:hypothetical protein